MKEHEKHRERKEKEGEVNIHQEKAVLQMKAVSEQWTWCKAACELTRAACWAQAGEQTPQQQDGEETGVLQWAPSTGSPKSPLPPQQRQRDGMQQGKVARREGERGKEGSYTCHWGLTQAKLTQRRGRYPCLSWVCVVVSGLGTAEEPQ